MHYTIQQLANLAGISTRTLRYYYSIDLLKPAQLSESGYRLYTTVEVDYLQQILFYRELGFPLAEIKNLVSNPDFDQKEALLKHLESLIQKQARLSLLIENAKNTLQTLQGEIIMTDTEKFKGFKESIIKKKTKNNMAKKYAQNTEKKALTKQIQK